MRQRSRLVIMTLVLLLGTGGMVSAAAYSFRAEQPRDLTYAPTDGAFSQVRLDGRAGQLEQALQPGAAFLSSGLPGAVALQHQPDDFMITHDLWVADARSGDDQLRVVFQISKSEVSLLGVITGTDGLVFSSGLPVSHGREHDLRHDQASGTMAVGTGEAPFTASTQVSGSGDCIDWSAKITSRTATADSVISLESCAGAGLQQVSYQRADRSAVRLSTVSRNQAHGRFSGSLTSAPISPDDLSRWKSASVDLALRDGTGVTPVYVEDDIPPAVLPDNRFAVAGVDHGLTVFTRRGKTAEVAWTAHPGGRISRLVSVGRLLVAITDQRQVIAYDSAGNRVWQHRTDDLVAAAAVSGARLIIAVYGTGIQALDLRTGQRLWQVSSDAMTGLLAADATQVAYGDSDKTSHRLDVRDGVEIGRSDGDSLGGVGLFGESLLSLRNHILYGRTLQGRAYVLNVRAGSVDEFHVTGQLGLVTGSDGVALIDLGTGRQVGTTPVAVGAVDGPGGVLVAGDSQTTVYIADGPSRASWSIKLPDDVYAQDLGLGSWGAVMVHGGSVEVIS